MIDILVINSLPFEACGSAHLSACKSEHLSARGSDGASRWSARGSEPRNGARAGRSLAMELTRVGASHSQGRRLECGSEPHIIATKLSNFSIAVLASVLASLRKSHTSLKTPAHPSLKHKSKEAFSAPTFGLKVGHNGHWLLSGGVTRS